MNERHKDRVTVALQMTYKANCYCNFCFCSTKPIGASLLLGGGGGVLVSSFAGYVPLASPNPYPIIIYSVANYRPLVSHFWANIPQIPTHWNLLTTEILQMCNPILVTLLDAIENATPLCSQSSRENATPSSSTSPLAYY